MDQTPKGFQSFKQAFARMFRDRRGATAVEYGLIAGLIGISVMITIGAIGTQMRDDVLGVINTSLSSTPTD
ncbi:Flp family type IVb pilin [Roseibium aggregatum]|nr:Flp family type IVb pilin [Roseibium aggregatum]